ncbi:MAG: DnaT-like ssDNA-binding domain-containing protein [Cellvibrionaceae bacterium]|nr:DnaT-like ssDNA-binding domain-containing protein [Cellvibrionaceae bacterium]
MSSPFDTERPILLSPALGATRGLEEATLFAVLAELADLRQATANGQWQLDQQDAHKRLPFFSPLDIERVSKSLAAKGVLFISSAPYQQQGLLQYSFNAPAASTPRQAMPIVSAPQVANSGGASLIAPNWQPDSDTLARLAQLNVDEAFARAQVPEFVTYWRDSGEAQRSWGAKFHQQVIRKWRERETFQSSREQMRPIDFDWHPSAEAMEMMTKHAGITPQFVEDAIPEFILYWQEKGTSADTWNSKFIQHVRRQWARYQSSLEHDAQPQILASNWQPSADVYDILRLANIDLQFAKQLIPEFLLYWRETKQAHSHWNTKFLQHVKYHWAQRHQLTRAPATAGDGKPSNRSTRERSLVEDLTDTSW